MNRDEAAQFFVDLIIKGVLNPCSSGVERGWETGKPKSLYGEISIWYLGLSEQDQRMVRVISADAMHSVLFRLMSLLDGIAGFSDADGKTMHIAVNVQEFADRSALSQGEVEKQVCINPLNQRDLLLHDILQRYLDQAHDEPTPE